VPRGMKNWYVSVLSDTSQGQLTVVPAPTTWKQPETIHQLQPTVKPYLEEISCNGITPENLVVKIRNVGSIPATFTFRSAFEESGCPSSEIAGCLPYDASATMAAVNGWSTWLQDTWDSSAEAWSSLQTRVPWDSNKGWTWGSWAMVWNQWPEEVARQLQEWDILSRRLEVTGWMSSFYFLDGLGERDDVISLEDFEKAYHFSEVYAKVSAFAEDLAAFDSVEDAWASLAGISQQLLVDLRHEPDSRWEVPWSGLRLPKGVSVRTVQEALTYLGVGSSETGTVTRDQMQHAYHLGVALKTRPAGGAGPVLRGKIRIPKQRSTETITQTTTTTSTSSTAPAPGILPTNAFSARGFLNSTEVKHLESELSTGLNATSRYFEKVGKIFGEKVATIFGKGPEGAGLAVVTFSTIPLLCLICCLIVGRRGQGPAASRQSREPRLGKYVAAEQEGDKADARVADHRLPPPKDTGAGGSICCCPSSAQGVEDPVEQTEFSGHPKGVSEFRAASPSAMLTERLPGEDAGGAGFGTMPASHHMVADSSPSSNHGRLLQLQSPGASLTGRTELTDPHRAGAAGPGSWPAPPRSAADIVRENTPQRVESAAEQAGLLAGAGESNPCCSDDRLVSEAIVTGADDAGGRKKCKCCRAPCICGGRRGRDKK